MREETAAAHRLQINRRVIVVGSVNIDSYAHVTHFPAPGETIVARPGITAVGGKGANQAIAAARSGASVTFIGRVGSDANGAAAAEALTEGGVNCEHLQLDSELPTGNANILLDPSGENIILVTSGANASISLETEGLLARTIGSLATEVVLTQGELGSDPIDLIADACDSFDKRFVLNLAPMTNVKPTTLHRADPLVLNEVEASALCVASGLAVTIEDIPSAGVALRFLIENVARTAVITLGPSGAIAHDGNRMWHQPAKQGMPVLDSTGAGDAFVGSLTAALAQRHSLQEAVRFGVTAATLAVGTIGTSNSYQSQIVINEAVATARSIIPLVADRTVQHVR
jgi:ribokinase